MKRNAQKHNRSVKALRDPKPKFVSLVRAGANMTPFLAVKAAQDPNPQEAFMGIKQHEIAKITFKADKFADEAAVKAWLEAGGYEGFEITAVEGGFEVVNKEAEFAEVRIVEADGVAVAVGKLAEDEVEEKTEIEEAAEKSEEAPAVVAVKEDEAKPDETGLAPAAKAEGGETVAPEAVKESGLEPAKVEEETAQKNMGAAYDLYYTLVSLKWLADDAQYVGLSDEDVSTIKTSAKNLIGLVAKMAQTSVDALNDAFKAAQKADGFFDQKVEAEAAAEKVEGEALQSLAEDPVIKSIVESLNALTAKVTELTATKAEERVTSLEETDQRQTRKSADVDEVALKAEEQPAVSDDSKFVAERRLRGALGL